jgi:DNA-binding transcriptional ArsR family regulator
MNRNGNALNELEKKNRLVEMRASGASMDKIAQELKMSKTTVGKWIKELEAEIGNREYEEYDLLIEKYKQSKKTRLESYLKILDKAHKELEKRSIEDMTTKDLLKLIEETEKKVHTIVGEKKFRTGSMKKMTFMKYFHKQTGKRKFWVLIIRQE